MENGRTWSFWSAEYLAIVSAIDDGEAWTIGVATVPVTNLSVSRRASTREGCRLYVLEQAPTLSPTESAPMIVIGRHALLERCLADLGDRCSVLVVRAEGLGKPVVFQALAHRLEDSRVPVSTVARGDGEVGVPLAPFADIRGRSKKVAARVGLFVRTVDNHLGSVFRKLGIQGRDELAEALVASDV